MVLLRRRVLGLIRSISVVTDKSFLCDNLFFQLPPPAQVGRRVGGFVQLRFPEWSNNSNLVETWGI
jgi:hypothetical protein